MFSDKDTGNCSRISTTPGSRRISVLKTLASYSWPITAEAATISVSSITSCQKEQTVLIKVIDVGASQMVIDGKIKIKNGSSIERFTKDGIKFADGSELPADVVIFATGYVSALIELQNPQS
jgi:hypothetical protein